ncbi:MAG: Asp-tRNA(Asn) amidotransferase subunit GatC [Methanobacteriaceae archaeon]|jgi:aspartyl-tRNA(Asn)/glutamyl-tRNA(Gln) amidotransferase subunit C|uniref:Asp-tRNA(Asn) amidotransferase subunit GatC n=1 Tax=Methanobrevibacter TaxID=2172 RepID=UPI002A184531|nr:Asp-tRNA(Asn) amidotransferase subunit GatC [Methanobacteriaceae archaeon]MDD3408936.1 Asp-tRNA(Asn) amidotransferase subunit GatC [Methanobacteriaceae archaeon]MDD4595012.1 Asp-tRNA(Asn) amidotransferase subunit GatC [Methanobacteriaceae archaeon]
MIEKDAEKILENFSKSLDTIPDLEETYYITDNLNLERKDEAHPQDSARIVRNTKTDKDGNVVVKKADWV